MRVSTILGHVAARLGVAIWRHRLAWVTSVFVIGALGAYQMGYAGALLSVGGTTTNNSDCADTAMVAVAKVDDQTAHAAYNCLGPNMRRTGEQDFVKSLRDRGNVPSGHVNRVGDQRLADGGRIVFFTVEAAGQVVGYIVYLDPMGKVMRIE